LANVVVSDPVLESHCPIVFSTSKKERRRRRGKSYSGLPYENLIIININIIANAFHTTYSKMAKQRNKKKVKRRGWKPWAHSGISKRQIYNTRYSL
jgi:hypothetical protein